MLLTDLRRITLVVVGLAVFALPSVSALAASLFGFWMSKNCFELDTLTLETEWEFSIGVRLNGTSCGLDLELTDKLESVVLSASTRLGSLDVDAEAEFSDDPPHFELASIQIGSSQSDLSWAVEAVIADHPSQSDIVVDFSTKASISLDVSMTLSTCPVSFESAAVVITDLGVCCVEDLEVELSFDCQGLEEISVGLSEIRLPFRGSLQGGLTWSTRQRKRS